MKFVYTAEFNKQMKKLDKQVVSKIKKYIDEIEQLENPRSRGHALSANLAGFWRYRIGDYRLICEIKDNEMTIFALKIGHRRNIYEY